MSSLLIHQYISRERKEQDKHMKAIRIHGRGGPDHLIYEEVSQPQPGPGEVLVRVYATGVIAPELTWPVTYQTRTGSPRAFPIPGHDLSGVVKAVGPDVPNIPPGLEVYALTAFDRDGAESRMDHCPSRRTCPQARLSEPCASGSRSIDCPDSLASFV